MTKPGKKITRLLELAVFAACIGISCYFFFHNLTLKKDLSRQALSYEYLLSEKLQLEKSYHKLQSELNALKPNSSDSLKQVIAQRDIELARLSRIIRQLNDIVERSKNK